MKLPEISHLPFRMLRIVGYYDATVNMSWQVDVFGSIRQRVKAQKENFAASREEYSRQTSGPS